MPNAPKYDFVAPKYPRRAKRRSVSDPFYFDPDAWARLEAAVAGRKTRTLKGDKRPAEEVERKMDSQRANKLRRQEAQLEAREVERRARRYAGPNQAHMILDAMAPGHWYGERDLCVATGLARVKVGAILHQRLAPSGQVSKLRNPDWQGRLEPRARALLGAGNVEPKYLWGITAQGEQTKKDRALLPGQGGAVESHEAALCKNYQEHGRERAKRSEFTPSCEGE